MTELFSPANLGRLYRCVFALCLLSGAAAAQTTAQTGDKFGDWLYLCRGIAEGETICSLNQTLIAEDTRERIARFQIVKNPARGNETTLVAVLPLGLALATQVVGRIDEGEEFPMPVQTCLSTGCVSRIALDSAAMEELKKGLQLSVAFTLVRNPNRLTVPVSLRGLTDGFTAGNF